ELGQVSGHVKLDGAPYAGAMVSFMPEAGGRPSVGVTGPDGSYVLMYTNEHEGAVLGKHKVSIVTAGLAGAGDIDPSIETSNEDFAEVIPAQYNTNTSLVEEVTAGEQVIDFDLSSAAERS